METTIAKKDLLFYSQLCTHSVSVLETVKQHHLTQRIMLVSVNNKNFNLPSFVDRVPLLYRQTTKEVLVEHDLDDYIASLTQNEQQLDHFNDLQTSGKFTDSFSFIDSNSDHVMNSSYEFVDNRIGSQPPPPPVVNESRKGNKVNDSDYELFLSRRDSDLKEIMLRSKQT